MPPFVNFGEGTMEQVARWRLTAPHYLKVPGTEWEHKETDRETQRAVRKMYPVPLLLDPKLPTDWNYPGEIIVSNGPYNRDIVFEGAPTPDMEPLNDAAEAITNAEKPKWQHPIESLASNGQQYADVIFEKLSRQLEALITKQGLPQVATTSVGQVSMEQFAELQKMVEQLAQQNAALQAQLAEAPAPAARRA